MSNVQELRAALTKIKTSAKQQIPSPVSNKSYRESATIVIEDDILIDASTAFMYAESAGAPLHFYGFKEILDLNGHTITVSEDALLIGKSYPTPCS